MNKSLRIENFLVLVLWITWIETEHICDKDFAVLHNKMSAVASFLTPFIPCPCEPSIPLDVWLKMFENYLIVVNASGDDWPVVRKQALFLHCLGTGGQRLFYTLPNQGETMEDAIKTLKLHFIPRRNIVAERHVFRSMLLLFVS